MQIHIHKFTFIHTYIRGVHICFLTHDVLQSRLLYLLNWRNRKTCTQVRVYMHVCTCVYMYIMPIYVCTYICFYMCFMCIHTYTPMCIHTYTCRCGTHPGKIYRHKYMHTEACTSLLHIYTFAYLMIHIYAQRSIFFFITHYAALLHEIQPTISVLTQCILC